MHHYSAVDRHRFVTDRASGEDQHRQGGGRHPDQCIGAMLTGTGMGTLAGRQGLPPGGGAPRLQIAPIRWTDDGWPEVAPLP